MMSQSLECRLSPEDIFPVLIKLFTESICLFIYTPATSRGSMLNLLPMFLKFASLSLDD